MLGQMFFSLFFFAGLEIGDERLGNVAGKRIEGNACKRREGECVCERSPRWMQRIDPRHHNNIIGISSRG